jgi:hypothetical protein
MYYLNGGRAGENVCGLGHVSFLGGRGKEVSKTGKAKVERRKYLRPEEIASFAQTEATAVVTPEAQLRQ